MRITPEKGACIGGWALLYIAFFCMLAGLIAPEEEWNAWARPAVTLIAGGIAALLWGYRKKLTFRL